MQLRCSLPCGNEIVSPDVGAQVVGSAANAFWRGMPRRARSSSPRSRLPNGCGTACGAPQHSSSRHTIDTSNHRDAGSAGADFRTTRGPAARERLWGESFSGRLLAQVFEESLLLFAGQELVIA